MHRQPVLKHGKILPSEEFAGTICSIHNMTPYGAELSVGANQRIPAEFLLFVRVDERTYRCRQRWRLETRLGIEVLETTSR